MALYLTGCSDGFNRGNGNGNGKNKVKKNDTEDAEIGITVTRTRCVKTELNTKYKYIVIAYPNGDKDLYCEVSWLRDRELYLSADHRYAPQSTCIIERDWDRYWVFSSENDTPQMDWFGTVDPEDAPSGSALSRSFEFDFCSTETFEDEYWFQKYYYFGENLI
jgi:hypothetical protein